MTRPGGIFLYAIAGFAALWQTGEVVLVLVLWLVVLPACAALVRRKPAAVVPVVPVERLTAGVAHDVNNLLGVIRASVEVVQARIPENDPLQSETRAMADAIDRGATLLRRLVPQREAEVVSGEAFDLKHMIGDLESLLKRMLPRGVELHVRADSTLWVMAHQPELEQLVVNLVANARDALAGSGEVWIDLGSKWLQQSELPAEGRLQPGNYAVLSVRDTGPGIPNEVLPRIFDPFFTTKAPGAGTGLGLAASRDLVCRVGGDVMVTSRSGAGTCFKILLPEYTPPGLHQSIRSRSRRLPSAFGPGTPVGMRVWAGEPGSGVFPRACCALIVDDQPELLRAASRVLSRAGYDVLTATDAEAAAEIVRSNPGRVSLLVTDVQLPGRSGPELAREMRARAPELALVYVTGSSEFDDAGGLSNQKAVLVRKPYRSHDLLSAVRAAESLAAA